MYAGKSVLVLYTAWQQDYWEKGKEAPYRKRSFEELSNWNELEKSLPIPGIGVYMRQREKDYRQRNFVYLRIKGMRYGELREPYFDFEPIRRGEQTSAALLDKIGQHKLFESHPVDQLIEILKELGEEPPSDWLRLAKERVEEDWRSWIGSYFLRAESDISNDGFEDVIADIFRAIGFSVEQMGHRVHGNNPDGILVTSLPYDFAIIYDCKNSREYYPNQDDKRALEDYLTRHKVEVKAKCGYITNVYSCFVAKSFDSKLSSASEVGADVLLDLRSLLYILYKRLRMGSKFTLVPFGESGKHKKRIDERFVKDHFK